MKRGSDEMGRFSVEFEVANNEDIAEPKRDTALIGAIVLEQLDLLVDCTKGCLVPRDPDNTSCGLTLKGWTLAEKLLKESPKENLQNDFFRCL